jgi:hypothetical protein
MAETNKKANVTKEAIIDAQNVTKAVTENIQSDIKNSLSEAVQKEFKKIMKEAVDDDDDENTVKDDDDSLDNDTNDYDELDTDEVDDADDAEDADDDEEDADTEDGDEDISADSDDEDPNEGDDEESDDLSDFEIGDGEYDLTNAEDDDVVKVYKRLKNDDEVSVVDDGDGKISIKDNGNGNEYLLDVGDADNGDVLDDDVDVNVEEGRNVYELLINEDNGDYGYTDGYQKKDAVTNNGNESHLNNGYSEWGSKGAPEGTSKPWSGFKNTKAKAQSQPFTEEEEMDEMNDVEEGVMTNTKWNKSHASKSMTKGNDAYNRYGTKKNSNNGEYKAAENVAEMKRVVNQLERKLNENMQMKRALKQIKGQVAEAALTNKNLSNIVRLFVGNSTTLDEKRSILERFSKEAVNRNASDKLFEAIKSELSNKKSMNESKQFGKVINVANSNKINETVLCEESGDVAKMRSLMERMDTLND